MTASGPYGAVVREHYRHPRNYGALERADIRREEVNALCGDRVRFELALGEDGTIREVRFQGDLCMLAKASASLLTEMVSGRDLAAVRDLSAQPLFDALHAAVHPSRHQCVLLPLATLQAGVRDHLSRR